MMFCLGSILGLIVGYLAAHVVKRLNEGDR